ncbi:hypothetical protein RND81_11G190900 [Saponaria officinalis]|uniref:Uncharacterized protein n=1 Tax=Saponaria officinalis TaxID=3572 RepID=A0AAW1HQ50_SAPOF
MKGILVNSYVELESFILQALVNGERKEIPPIYPAGPILEMVDKNPSGSRGENESVIQWLDGQPKSSVVFLCFGRMGTFDEEQVKEIANGLDRSGYDFLGS